MPALASSCLPSSPGFSSSRQRVGGYFTVDRNFEKFSDIDGKCGRNAIENIDRYVEIAALNSADGGSINTRIYGKVFLRHLFSGAYLTQIPTKSLTSIHDRMATILMALNPSDISDLFQFRRELCALGDKQ